jgi:protein-S-isoprenylcysteine O-methyltransferase Ste14
MLLLRLGQAQPSTTLTVIGAVLTGSGELLRLWAVHHIGAVSRTRSDRLGPLIASGPFALSRNPLYIGNITLWVGFALMSRLVWMAPTAALLLGAEYHAIVRWEEHLLESRFGDSYRAYVAAVPRWLPRLHRRGRRKDEMPAAVPFSWKETLFSERGTLVAIVAGCLLLWLKLRA